MGAMRILGLGLIVAVAGGLVLAASPAAGQVKIPPDFILEKSKDSPAQVTFSHERHKEKADKCTACHTKIFKMKKGQTGPLTMEKMKAGEQCGTCHNGKTQMGGKVVFAVADEKSCDTCHKK